MTFRVILLSALTTITALQSSGAASKGLFDEKEASAFLSRLDAEGMLNESKKFDSLAGSAYADGKFDDAAQYHFSGLLLASFASEAKNLPGGLKEWLLLNPDLCAEFYSAISPKDNLENAFKILGSIWQSDSGQFKKYPRVAMAISIVYDAPPPETWPHAQVNPKVLPRKLPNPELAFKRITDMRERGKCLIQTERLSISELRFLVASPASDEDRQWAQKSVQVNLSNLDKLYASISYDHGRVARNAFSWEGDDYSLKTIKSAGGICVDQAYYTSEIAKSRGVPAFIFSGAGASGFHAWAACMTKVGNWNFDIGRYEGARFVTGDAIDPQTWERASDHALESMREGFRNGPKYALNELHTIFAKKYFDSGDISKAESAARKAISADARNAETWRILIDCAKSSGETGKLRGIYDAALRSFSKYPDTDAEFRREYISWLTESGDAENAKKLSSSIIVKTKSSRPDLAMSFARNELEADIASGDHDKLISSYKRLLSSFKSDGAMTFHGLCVPIINALLKAGKTDETFDILKTTRQVLKSSKDETLEAGLNQIEKQLANIKNAN